MGAEKILLLLNRMLGMQCASSTGLVNRAISYGDETSLTLRDKASTSRRFGTQHASANIAPNPALTSQIMIYHRPEDSDITPSTELDEDRYPQDEHGGRFTAVDINDFSAPFVDKIGDPSEPPAPKASRGLSIGWLTPILIIGGFLTATAVAIANYIYFEKIGGGKGRVIEDTGVSQEWNNAITQIFARAFSISLAASASPAFAQLLWWYLRRKALPLDQIEALFQINFGPLNLYQVGLLRVVPLLWLFGLLFPLIPIATIFPPGSLVVEQVSWPQNSNIHVPTLDVDYRGNGSKEDFFKYAMFDVMTDGDYKMPFLEYSAIGKRSLLEGSYIKGLSPCGVNCSYDIVFAAPSLQCQDTDVSAVAQQYPNMSFDDSSSYNGFYKAGSFHQFNDQYQLIVLWGEDQGSQQKAIPRALRCVAMAAYYNAHVSYTNSIQVITTNISDEVPLNATALYTDSLFYDVWNAKDGPNGFEYVDPYHNYSMEELNDLYHGCQLLSIVESFAEPLNGEAATFGTDGYDRSASLFQEMPLPQASYNGSTEYTTYKAYDLSPDLFRGLMTNVSLSIFNAATNSVQTLVTMNIYRASYVFKSPSRLIAAYTTALVATAIFLVFGFCAMLHNGVSAAPGGFMQILCTTTHGNGTLNHLARQACVGGTNNMSKDLKGLKVRFGEISGQGDQSSFVAFGTEEETRPLVKGSTYDALKGN